MPAPPPLSRRTVLLVAAGTAVLSGCDADDLKPHDAAPTAPAPRTTPGQPSADEQLVDGVAASILTTVGTVAAARRVAGLTAPLATVLHTHRAHLAALKQPARPPRVVGPREAAAALAAVRAAEQELQSRLVDAAVRAQSGALAALLASMSASVGQLLVGLPQPPVTP